MSRHHYGARLHEYTERGYRTLALENASIRVEMLADKGTDIITFLHKPSDTDFMWHRPGGLPAAAAREHAARGGRVRVRRCLRGRLAGVLPQRRPERALQGSRAALPRGTANRAVRVGGAGGCARGGFRSPVGGDDANPLPPREDPDAAGRGRGPGDRRAPHQPGRGAARRDVGPPPRVWASLRGRLLPHRPARLPGDYRAVRPLAGQRTGVCRPLRLAHGAAAATAAGAT